MRYDLYTKTELKELIAAHKEACEFDANYKF